MKQALVMLLLCGAAHAEPTWITVPGEGWSVKLDAPPMTNIKGEREGRRFKYLASNTETGVTFSIHTETAAADNKDSCRATYWARGSTNPTLVKESVRQFESDAASFVTHRSEGSYKGTPFKTANGHAYLVKGGLCLDVHVSHWPYRDDSEALVEKVLRSVSIAD